MDQNSAEWLSYFTLDGLLLVIMLQPFFQKGRDMLPHKEKHLNAQTYYITMQQVNAGGSKVKRLKAWITPTNMFISYHPTRLQICTVVWVEYWTRWEKRPCRITAQNSVWLNACTCVEERKGDTIFYRWESTNNSVCNIRANIMWKIQHSALHTTDLP